MCRPYSVSPRLQSSLSVSPTRQVFGVTQCDNKLFVVCRDCDTIFVFGPNNERLTNIKLTELKRPRDIVYCTETRQLYIADYDWRSADRVWRVSCDGRQVVEWLTRKSTTTSKFRPYTLSVTAGRLLVTNSYKAFVGSSTDELLLFSVDGVELNRVSSPDMKELRHAVETSRGTFIVSHYEPQPQVSEVDVTGHVIRVYCDQQQLVYPIYLSLDSEGRVFVADYGSDKHQVLLLTRDLELERVLLDTQQHQSHSQPLRLCYVQQTHQLVVGCKLKLKTVGRLLVFSI